MGSGSRGAYSGREAGQLAEVEVECTRQRDQGGWRRYSSTMLEVRDVRPVTANYRRKAILRPTLDPTPCVDELAEPHADSATRNEMCVTETIYRDPDPRNRDGMRGPMFEQLKRARLLSRLTGSEIADKVGWKAPSTVSNVERGARDTQLSEASKWAEACGYELALIPKGDPDPEGLADLVAAIEDPAARNVLAALARLTARPHRYWLRLLDDIEYAEAKAARDEAEDASQSGTRH